MGKSATYGLEGFKEQLAEFMQTINPKPNAADLEALRQKYIDQRDKKHD